MGKLKKYVDYFTILTNCSWEIVCQTALGVLIQFVFSEIAVKFNTYECIGDSFISEKPEYITTDEECATQAINLIKKTLEFSKEEYRKEAIKSFDSVKRVYDVDNCMKSFMSTKTNYQVSLLSTKDYFFFSLYKKYVHMKTKKIKGKYDYNDLQKEND